MEKAFEFLKKEQGGGICHGGRGQAEDPRLPDYEAGKETLYFVTAPSKEVYQQLRANPNVEILAMKGNLFVRIAGQAVFDVDDKTAREIYAANPVLPRLYKSYTDLVYFRLSAESLDYYDLTPTPPLQEHCEYGEK